MTPSIKSVIMSVGHYLPERIMRNSDFEKLMDTSNEWITERTGITERRFVEPGVKTSDLAIQAATNALKNGGFVPHDIDYIIGATLSPDFYFPGIAPIVQNKMGFKNVPALDIRTQCSGFVYGLSLADSLIKSKQAKRVLLVCAEVQSPCLDLTTRGRDMAVLFGDGAAAVVVEAQNNSTNEDLNVQHNQRGIIDSLSGSDGSGATILSIKSPGTATPGFVKHEDIDAGLTFPHMEGKTVFKNAIVRMSEAVSTILTRNNISKNDIDLFVPHQANLRINEYLRDKLEIPHHKFFNNIQKYGNTTSATIPICLSEASQSGVLQQGNLIVTVAFGAGFTWGANLIRW